MFIAWMRVGKGRGRVKLFRMMIWNGDYNCKLLFGMVSKGERGMGRDLKSHLPERRWNVFGKREGPPALPEGECSQTPNVHNCLQMQMKMEMGNENVLRGF